jgi:glutathione synthase
MFLEHPIDYIRSLCYKKDYAEVTTTSKERPKKSVAYPSLEELLQQAVQWCFTHGLVMLDKIPVESVLPRVIPAPISLMPSPFPRQWYEWTKEVQPLLNLLVDRISQHETFLIEALSR